ncbi:MAG: HNH endonuclease [Spirochaetia bacterium]|jgi:putative restriction endonuclease|nr:HNH endonuclease [Spirochaetia bacterium]
MLDETDIRIQAFQWLRDRERWNDGIFLGQELNKGFQYKGSRITLKGQTGIWFPAGFSTPISITTSKKGPYDLDDIGDDGLLVYAYRGTDKDHRDNRGLRQAMRTRTPLIYFKEVHNHRYQAIWPVMILDDYPESLYVRAAVDPAYSELRPGVSFEDTQLSPLDLRRYAWTQTRHRLHQGAFRELVVSAYDQRCAICRLNHPELLDAAHIIADSDDRGFPVVQNGLSLCKIHHAAYDQNILGVDSDYRVHVREDILLEKDGPMLKHGIQELNGSSLILPRRVSDKPDQDRLSKRFEEFRMAVS